MRFEGRRAPSNACGIGGGQPGNGDPLAPRRLPSLLALTIKASRWPSEDATRDPTTHSRYEHREPAPPCLGERTCQVRLPPPRGSKFAATAKVLAAERYFRPTFVLGVAGPSPPDCAPRYTGQLSRRIGRERTYCTCPPANPVAGAPRPTQGGDHASHSIYCRPAQGRMADQVR